ncbi:Gfo/Idh/MocA family protein [Leifsonia aquatica]|uniref:Oxidoreductase, NAD-binding domain protein n=2 Tax=Leifsonia aquatica TaxID=144185 RepID=U2RUE8_LEIAQ|nr:Gfo/Idh/MocA family oxidoreductase [Leifsonia aquatica]ERK72174.1 oxidoreductase, NAD-binding domain protein [Leifsonia aquatica ATCC 14665]MBB2968304.1 putative dehydrogenase [Leifsonia aquatica]
MTFTVAVLGTGAFAREHLLALRGIPDVRVSHVAGSSLERATELAALVPGARATTDLAAVVSHPEVDGVDVCNATPDHAAWTIAAGRAGKHVHVDKPATLTVEAFDEMVAATEGRGRTLMVGQTVRFQPAVAELQARAAAGAIGDPRLLHITWYTGHVWPGGWRGWQLDTGKSGGHPVHNGTHALDLAVWLMGSEPVEVFGRDFPTFAAEMPMPDSFQLLVRFANGALATIELCYALTQPGRFLRRVLLAGTEGTLLHDTDAEPGLASPRHSAPPASLDGALADQLAHWVRAAQGREPMIVTTEQARAALATAVAAQRSLRTGRPIAVESAPVGVGAR